MRTLAVSNYKGGVGKTTTAVNLAHVFASEGMRVLLVDLDPQASATDFFGLYDRAHDEKRSSIGLLYDNMEVGECVFEDERSGICVVPSLIELVDQNELMLHEQTLKFALDDAGDAFDIAIVDCSPVMKRLAFSAYIAASEGGLVIIPVKLDSSVMRGTTLTVNAMRSISNSMRLPMPKWRILRTCVPGRETINDQIGTEVLDGYFPENQFATTVHASSKVCEGSWQWSPVVDFRPNSRPARDYRALAKEVLDAIG